MRASALLVVSVLMVGCGSAMWASVPVNGSDASLQGLAGRWEGTLEGAAADGKAVIHFNLPQGSRFAQGQVIFNANDPAKATTVPIKQVGAAEDGRIVGVIGPYLEPQRGVQVQTNLVGARQGNTISGLFTTRTIGIADDGHHGRWQMTKKD